MCSKMLTLVLPLLCTINCVFAASEKKEKTEEVWPEFIKVEAFRCNARDEPVDYDGIYRLIGDVYRRNKGLGCRIEPKSFDDSSDEAIILEGGWVIKCDQNDPESQSGPYGYDFYCKCENDFFGTNWSEKYTFLEEYEVGKITKVMKNSQTEEQFKKQSVPKKENTMEFLNPLSDSQDKLTYKKICKPLESKFPEFLDEQVAVLPDVPLFPDEFLRLPVDGVVSPEANSVGVPRILLPKTPIRNVNKDDHPKREDCDIVRNDPRFARSMGSLTSIASSDETGGDLTKYIKRKQKRN